MAEDQYFEFCYSVRLYFLLGKEVVVRLVRTLQRQATIYHIFRNRPLNSMFVDKHRKEFLFEFELNHPELL